MSGVIDWAGCQSVKREFKKKNLGETKAGRQKEQGVKKDKKKKEIK